MRRMMAITRFLSALRITRFIAGVVLTLGCCVADAGAADAPPPARPNVVYILCDDLGYGDVRCLNPQGRIPTPHLDRLAAEGMAFTDAHSGSSVCTPTRYGILTGRYAWRSRLQRGVLGGLSPRLIEPGRLTVAEYLRQQGYATACVGKWHLGMDWATHPGRTTEALGIETPEQAGSVDFTHAIRGGPLSVGFDRFFGIAASLDMVPYTFIRDDRVEALPTATMKLPMKLGKPGFTREGPGAPGFRGDDVLATLTREAVGTIGTFAPDAAGGKPFFLYLPLTSPHTPILPSEPWRGKSGLNDYADFVMETDAAIGQVLAALENHGMARNTLVIVTSDNGCSPAADFPALAAAGHAPSHVFRGAKADLYEGGHRVPFLVRWPARVAPGRKSDNLLCLTDLFATMADILGSPPPDDAAEDSISFLPALQTVNGQPRRDAVVHHSITGSFAIRQGRWKALLATDSGGWSSPRPGSAEAATLPDTQLYDLVSDIGETTNVAATHPDVVSQLTHLLDHYVAEGRSTPGPRQANAVDVDVRAASRRSDRRAAQKVEATP